MSNQGETEYKWTEGIILQTYKSGVALVEIT